MTLPAGGWSNGTKNHAPGNLAGVNVKRDIPRFVRLLETGQFDGRSPVGTAVPLDKWRDALQGAADRTTITGIVVLAST